MMVGIPKESPDLSDPEPLVPVSEIPEEQLPVVHIEKEVRDALEICGYERAKNGIGSIKRNVRGVLGEYAVAKYYGNPEAVDTEIYQYGDGGIDLQILSNVQVKTCNSSVNTPQLIVDAREELRADHYMQVQQLDRSTIRLIGYAPVSTVANARISRLHLDGYAKKVRMISQCDLWQPPRPVYSKEPLQ